MIRINEQYIDNFRLIYGKYYYTVCKGVYFSFDGETKEYINVETMFLNKYSNWIQTKCEEKMNELLRRGILEFIEEEES